MSKFAEAVAWARENKARGEIKDFSADVRAGFVEILTESGWHIMYDEDVHGAPQHNSSDY